MVWLHGTVQVIIEAARDVPTEAHLEVLEKHPVGKVLGRLQHKIGAYKESDTYCVVNFGGSRRARTRVIENCSHPVWNEAFAILVADNIDNLTIDIKDADLVGASHLAEVKFTALEVASGRPIQGWYPTYDTKGLPVKTTLKLSITYFPARNEPGLRGDMAAGGAVPDVYFPQRVSCDVRLYSDAHQEPGPGIQLANGQVFHARSLWTDMYTDITQAREFIYVTGWSVQPHVQLIRDPTKPQSQNQWPDIGALLTSKAAEGVRVLVLVWEDRTSFESALYSRDGIMGTQERATLKYFQGTQVVCVLCPRLGGTEDSASLNKRFQTGTFFTHHQKAVILDGPGRDGRGHVISYMGGVDLTLGRFDTKDHRLFSTLGTTHSDDFYQGCVAGATAAMGGPRQPWHDIHCRLEGPAAHDVLHNFCQRWAKQAGRAANLLLDLNSVGLYTPRPAPPGPPLNNDPALFITQPEDPEGWRVQLFRSIDSDSVSDFPLSNQDAMSLGLMSGKGKAIDYSAQKAYIHAIRRAQHFIYIENQYFLGSSHLWAANTESGCTHLIPAEIALKIVSKINAGERFAVYVVMPMFPEGVPSAASVQEILCFQTNTIRMMYRLITEALVANGRTHEHPRDYLSFFCLGNRELPTPGEQPSQVPPPPGSFLARAQQHRRHMVYVHSKMMIVDDEFIILGSANINQRSMDGSRDTELAMGAFQPGYTAGLAPNDLPKGQVHGFRLTLWNEHVNGTFPSFLDPASVACMREMGGIGAANWAAYIAQANVDLRGHLMTYPLYISQDGRVEPLEGQRCFPDTDASVMGLASGTLPDILTT